MSSQREQDEIEKYKEAVWSFIIEHCDVLDTGKIFVKFHIDGKSNFEKRVWARYRYDYHREDWKSKNSKHQTQREVFVSKKKEKKQAYLLMKRTRRKDQQKVNEIAEWSKWYQNTQHGGILRRLIGYIASKTWKKKP